ncbi:UNVERIFIED_CONTAM: protein DETOXIFICATION 29 [Sesamum angustifolium]|uniref:Protein DETOXIFICATION 29 n=1 Tax=Sesamum angustifolium TaxID=2727405 RepID=A0AAW2Q970_9LAMI
MEDSTAQAQQPLLSPVDDEQLPMLSSLQDRSAQRISTHFIVDGDDIPPISGVGGFFKAFKLETEKLWYLAGPAIFTAFCQFSLGAITQTLAGHVGTLDLAAFAIENLVIAGFSFGVMTPIFMRSSSNLFRGSALVNISASCSSVLQYLSSISPLVVASRRE